MWIAIGIILFILLVLFILTLVCYCTAFYYPPKKRKFVYLLEGKQYEDVQEKIVTLVDEMKTVPFERVETVAADGITLRGKYYHTSDDAPLHIQFHGYKGTALRDLSGGNKLAREAGYNTLVVDQRAHGESDGKTITFGVKERYDCLCWIEYAKKRFGESVSIYLSGVSMGAATVLMATELDLPENVRGVIADCPYSSPEAIIRKTCKDMGVPPALGMPFVRFGARIFGRFKVREASAVTAVKNAKVPILLIHGEADDFVPCEMSKEIYEACASKKTLVTFENAGHGLSYVLHTDRYAAAVKTFMQECEESI